MANDSRLIGDVIARNEGSRIAYYRTVLLDDVNLWDDHWACNVGTNLREYYQAYLRGYLGHGQLQRAFLKHLPRGSIVLEGGCGMGQHAVALRARGYNCIGIDFAARTIERVKNYLPDLPLEVGDICQLNFKDESVGAYISLGVMEHFKDGPYCALKEALRVLKKNGILLVSVPQAFQWRRAGSLAEGSQLPENALFYQYAFSSSEFRTILTNLGFHIVAEYGYGSHFAFRIQFNKFRSLLKRFPRLAHLDLIMDRTPLGRNLARMRLYIAKKGLSDA
jgi:SAM-dependent methyltransferase